MNVLLLTQVLPYPPDSGPKVKTWNVIKYLKSAGHTVTLVSFVRGDQAADVAHLREYCAEVHTVAIRRGPFRDGHAMLRSLANGWPWMIVRDDRAAMRTLIDRLCAKTQFDIAHADQLNMAQYASRVRGARKVLDAHNALWLLYKRLAQTMDRSPKRLLLERDWRLLKVYEGHICRTFDGVLTVSEEDCAALQEAAGRTLDMTVIPIAIDTDEVPVVERKPNADHIVHVGTMYWPPNIDAIHWFVDTVLPQVRQRRSQVCFDCIGARPPKELLALNENVSLGVNMAGYVADPLLYLQQAGVMVVPVRAGGGIRVKILNGMSQGLPIVTTTIGCEGIAIEHGRHALIADTPEAFADAIVQVLGNRTLADELGRNGRQLAESKYDYRAACKPMERVYDAI